MDKELRIKNKSGILICLFIFLIIDLNAQITNQKGYFINGVFNGLDAGTIRIFSRNGNVEIIYLGT